MPRDASAIDPAHSRFGFVARHAMVTEVRGGIPVHGGAIPGRGNPHAAAHPHITFDSISVEHRDGDSFGVTGDLTVRGVP